jgi:hypothetical protein
MDENQNKRENKWVLFGLIGSVVVCAIAMAIFMYLTINS